MEDKFIIHGPEPTTFLEGKTLGNVFYNALLKQQHLPVAMVNVHSKEKISYEEILTYSSQLAQSLYNWGLSTNDVIAICSENSERYCIPVLSGFYTGIAVTLLNNNYTERELSNITELAEPTIIFCSLNTLNKILFLKNKYDFIKKIIVLNDNSEVLNVDSLKNFIDNNCDKDFNVKLFQPTPLNSDEQTALIMCSSGTTGVPKAVELTHTNVRIRLIHSQDTNFTPIFPFSASVLQLMPMYHALGLSMTLSYILSGYRIVIMEKFEPHLFLDSIQTYKIIYTILVPPLFIFLTKNPIVLNYDLSSLKYIGSGGAPLKKELCEATIAKFESITIMQGYGLTECTSAVIISQLTKSKLGSIGNVGPLVTAKVINPETGKTLGPNEIGELCFKGATVMKGYVKNTIATEEIIDKDGWLHSGDVGYFDEDRDFFIVDRLKDLIKYKGFQVSPSELEQVLLEHSSIQDVGIVSVADEIAGELPAACVVVRPEKQITENEVKDFVTDKVSYPKYLRGGVYFVNSIPKNNTGKIDRKELKKMFEALRS